MIYNTKKAQGLPLNTIVIALLVVVVLVVIILAFTTNVGNFNRGVDDQSASQCRPNNPAIVALFGENAITNLTDPSEERKRAQCQSEFSRVPGVGGNPDVPGSICCARRNE